MLLEVGLKFHWNTLILTKIILKKTPKTQSNPTLWSDYLTLWNDCLALPQVHPCRTTRNVPSQVSAVTFLVSLSFWSQSFVLKTNRSSQSWGAAPLRRMDGLCGSVPGDGAEIWSLLSTWKPRCHLCNAVGSSPHCACTVHLCCLGKGISAQCPALVGHSSLGQQRVKSSCRMCHPMLCICSKQAFQTRWWMKELWKTNVSLFESSSLRGSRNFCALTSKKHLTLCDQFLLLIIKCWKTWTSSKSLRWKGARISQKRLGNPYISINICWSAFL